MIIELFFRLLSLLVSKYAIACVVGMITGSFMMINWTDYAKWILILDQYIALSVRTVLGLT